MALVDEERRGPRVARRWVLSLNGREKDWTDERDLEGKRGREATVVVTTAASGEYTSLETVRESAIAGFL